MGRTLIHYQELNNRYSYKDIHPLIVDSDNQTILHEDIPNSLSSDRPVFNVASIYTMLEVLKKLQRPDDAGMWQTFSSNQSISWKTGTSFGFRDAWAIGINAKYTIGIWVGNSSGEGRPSLLGAKVAAPILFDVLSRLPNDYSIRFEPPLDELVPVEVCHISGMKASSVCPVRDTIYSARYQNQTLPCHYHQTVLVNTKNGLKADLQCYPSAQLSQRVIFNLPSLEEYYYAVNHPEYEKMPLTDPLCDQRQESHPMSMIQPEPNSSIYIPLDQYGKPGKVIFKLAHRRPETLVYWHLDDKYIGSTHTFHELAIIAETGSHLLTMIDSLGNELKCPFNILPGK
jgi:penicillin-binding protein 1C